jgi:hypothetical protein
MNRTTRVIGAGSIVLAPLATGIGGALGIMARPPEEAGGIVDSEYGVESQLTDLAGIAENEGLFTGAAALSYAATLLTACALVAIWRLSVDRSPRWAWAGAITAALGVFGLVVHTGYYANNLAAVDAPDRRAAAEFLVHMDSTPFLLAMFLPFFLALLSPVVQAVGLRRARVIPLWAVLSVAVATALMLVTGNAHWSNALWTALVLAGFTPAAAAMLRSGARTPAGGRGEPQPAPATAAS